MAPQEQQQFVDRVMPLINQFNADGAEDGPGVTIAQVRQMHELMQEYMSLVEGAMLAGARPEDLSILGQVEKPLFECVHCRFV